MAYSYESGSSSSKHKGGSRRSNHGSKYRGQSSRSNRSNRSNLSSRSRCGSRLRGFVVVYSVMMV